MLSSIIPSIMRLFSGLVSDADASALLEAHDSGVVNVNWKQVELFMQTHPEHDYVLVDVREPGEYDSAHVAGAWLIPLGDVLSGGPGFAKLKKTSYPFKFVMCRGGRRSAKAASHLASVASLSGLFNVSGGISAWTGPTLSGMPKVTPGQLKTPTDVRDLVDRLAAQTKKSLTEFAARNAGEHVEVSDAFDAVKRHAEQLKTQLASPSDNPTVETDKSLVDAIPLALLPPLRQVALNDYDLFRNLAHEATSDKLQNALLTVAEQQKHFVIALSS